MSKYKLAIFDFDGTLFATHEAIIHCVTKTFEEYKETVPTRDAIYQTITKGIALEETFKSLKTVSENKDEAVDTGQKWVETYREIYKKEGESKTKPFDNAKLVLEHIHNAGIPIVVISNKGIEAINSALEKYDLKKFIMLVVGDTKGMKKKPDPMIFNQLIKPQFKDVKPDKTLVVGDTSADLLFARNIGADACWAMYGYGVHDECNKLNSTFNIKDLLDIQSIFINIEVEYAGAPARLSRM